MSTLFVFDGIGLDNAGLLQKLRGLSSRPQNAAYFDVLCSSVERTLDYVGEEVVRTVLPEGIPLRSWLQGGSGPASSPSSVVGGVLGIAHQLCHLQPMISATASLDPPVAVLGHSLGLHAGVVAGLQIHGPAEYFTQCAASVRLVVLCLIRAHQVFQENLGHRLASDDVERYPGSPPPAPMASVTGIGTPELRALMESVQPSEPEGPRIGLINSPRHHVLTGRPSDLVDLRAKAETHLRSAGATWTFLPSTAPFHSPILAPALELLREDRPFIGFEAAAGHLRIPVISTLGGADLGESPDLFGDIVALSLTELVDWPTAVAQVITSLSPTHVLDVGPGPGARAFTRDCLRGDRVRLAYQSVDRLRSSV